MVHHVSFGTEALSAVLRAVEGAVVVVHPHVDGQVMPVVEWFLTCWHSADEFRPRLMVSQVGFEVLWGAKFLPTGGVGALVNLRFAVGGINRDQTLPVLALEALSGHLSVVEELIAGARVLVRALSFLGSLSLSEICLSADTQQTERLLCWLLYVAFMIHE